MGVLGECRSHAGDIVEFFLEIVSEMIDRGEGNAVPIIPIAAMSRFGTEAVMSVFLVRGICTTCKLLRSIFVSTVRGNIVNRNFTK